MGLSKIKIKKKPKKKTKKKKKKWIGFFYWLRGVVILHSEAQTFDRGGG